MIDRGSIILRRHHNLHGGGATFSQRRLRRGHLHFSGAISTAGVRDTTRPDRQRAFQSHRNSDIRVRSQQRRSGSYLSISFCDRVVVPASSDPSSDLFLRSSRHQLTRFEIDLRPI
ncbi:hypothetical protein M6B38_251575 [Iris pallida]|uniref:Uncharacterized protein n=1 Tax=Iris pallida TaxID=29817 RepID=A0AAX6IIZ8_IRIPA|nr:hypothetical protein M6B38_251575 [Iris pallida]